MVEIKINKTKYQKQTWGRLCSLISTLKLMPFFFYKLLKKIIFVFSIAKYNYLVFSKNLKKKNLKKKQQPGNRSWFDMY